MNSFIKKSLIIITSVFIFYFLIKILIVSWVSFFSNPNKIYALEGEKNFFNEIKMNYNVKLIERYPKYEQEIDTQNETTAYTIYLYYNKNADTTKFGELSKKISNRLSKMKLDKRFNQIKIVFSDKVYNLNGKVYCFDINQIK